MFRIGVGNGGGTKTNYTSHLARGGEKKKEIDGFVEESLGY